MRRELLLALTADGAVAVDGDGGGGGGGGGAATASDTLGGAGSRDDDARPAESGAEAVAVATQAVHEATATLRAVAEENRAGLLGGERQRYWLVVGGAIGAVGGALAASLVFIASSRGR